MKEKISQFYGMGGIVPALLFLVIFLAYGLLIPWMGFYWDDLPFAWILKTFGPTEFIEAFRPFRPLVGFIFAVTTSVFGGNPLTWQIIGLIIRFLLGLEIWILLRNIWPRQQNMGLWVALLFTVYPAYQQQWVALTHVNQELIPLFFLFASFIITTWGVRNDRSTKLLTTFAVLLQALALFSTEYFFGLEILRFLFVLPIIGEIVHDRRLLLKKTAEIWLPYFIVWIINAGWTYAYHRSIVYNSYGINIFSSLSLMTLINEFLNTLSLSGFTAWLRTFSMFSVIDGSTTQIISIVVLFTAALPVYIVMHHHYQKDAGLRKDSDRFGIWLVITGFIGIFAGRLPSWVAGLPLKTDFDYDRLFISIMLGACLSIVGLANLLLREGRRKIVLLSILVGLSTASQFSTANTFRRDWANQQDFFGEMAWRIPALKEGTAVLAEDLPLKYASDLQLTALLNWMYKPDFDGRVLPYAMLYIKTRFSPSELKTGQPITLPYRTVEFNGNMSNVVVINKEADGCVRVLDQVYNNAATVPGASSFLINSIPLSNPKLILTNSSTPKMDVKLFGNEPPHGWCYVYEKAEIERLSGNWEEVANLYYKAQKSGLDPALPVEYLPFIEAFALTGDTDIAIELTQRTIRREKLLCLALYTLWDRVSQNTELSNVRMDFLDEECIQ